MASPAPDDIKLRSPTRVHLHEPGHQEVFRLMTVCRTEEGRQRLIEHIERLQAYKGINSRRLEAVRNMLKHPRFTINMDLYNGLVDARYILTRYPLKM